MFAPRVPKPKADFVRSGLAIPARSSASPLLTHHGLPPAQRDAGSAGPAVEGRWDLSRISLVPTPTDRSRQQDQTAPAGAGSGASPTPAPAPIAAAPVAPTVDRIDLVNSTTAAIGGFPGITSGNLNSPGPYNHPDKFGVNHALQVHFHLGTGNSTALVPRREIQRTATFGGKTDLNPPDRIELGQGSHASSPGGFDGIVVGPDGPGAWEIRRPTTDKLVVGDAPGMGPAIPKDAFPYTYKAHFTVTVAAGATDVGSIAYDVLIDKRSSRDVPNTQNVSNAFAKRDLVNGKALP
jgi:hypothetical protein